MSNFVTSCQIFQIFSYSVDIIAFCQILSKLQLKNPNLVKSKIPPSSIILMARNIRCGFSDKKYLDWLSEGGWSDTSCLDSWKNRLKSDTERNAGTFQMYSDYPYWSCALLYGFLLYGGMFLRIPLRGFWPILIGNVYYMIWETSFFLLWFSSIHIHNI